jgi:hypothetical protein
MKAVLFVGVQIDVIRKVVADNFFGIIKQVAACTCNKYNYRYGSNKQPFSSFVFGFVHVYLPTKIVKKHSVEKLYPH